MPDSIPNVHMIAVKHNPPYNKSNSVLDTQCTTTQYNPQQSLSGSITGIQHSTAWPSAQTLTASKLSSAQDKEHC